MIPNLPHTRSDFLDRNVDAQKELEHTLENSITLEQEDKQKAILAESATLPTPENLRDLEEKEEIAAFREKLSDTPTEILCALFEDKMANGTLLVLVTLELKKRLQDRKLSESQEMLVAMSFLHLSSEGLSERYPSSFKQLPDAIENLISDHHRMLAALDQLKHGGRPSVIAKARADLDHIFAKETDKDLVAMHIRALRAYFTHRFGGLVEKSEIPRAMEMLMSLRSVMDEETREFLFAIAKTHPTEDVRIAAVHTLVYEDNPEARKRLAGMLKEEDNKYVGQVIASVLGYCISDSSRILSKEEETLLREAIEDWQKKG